MDKAGTQKYVQDLQGHIKILQKENDELKTENAELHCEIQAMNAMPDSEYARELEKQISDLESELSVKENLLKIRNSVNECQDVVGFLLHSEPISVAEQLINANYERKLSDLEKSLRKVTGCDCETTIENVYSVSDLRQIAEHLLVYCNHNSEE